MTAPASTTSGISFQITVTALDSTGAKATSDNATVALTSSDTRAAFGSHGAPADANLTLSQGVATATVTLFTLATQTITATDKTTSSITGTSAAINVGSSQFSAAGTMSTAREFHTATLLSDGAVLVAGGDDGANVLGSAELFDPATEQFLPTGSLATARQKATATLLSNGQVLIAGGFGASGQALNSTELYDPIGKTFSPGGDMAVARGLHTATVLQSGKILVAGGAATVTGVTALISAEIYDPAANTFSAAGTMASARTAHIATLLNTGKVLVAGGFDQTANSLNSAELFDPSSNSFSAITTPMTAARAAFTATLLADGRLLLAGGDNIETRTTTNPFPTSTGELFDPVAGTFTTVGSMTQAREAHTATLLRDGSVLLVAGDYIILTGGTTRAGAFIHSVPSTELFDLTTGTFTTAQRLTTDRTHHTATLLANGEVLVIGGSQYHSAGLQNPTTQVPLSDSEELQ